MNVPSRGLLVPLYDSTQSEHIKELKTRGWTLLRGAIPPERVTYYKEQFDKEFNKQGFGAKFSTGGYMLTKDLPACFWTIDTSLSPLGATATELRFEMRNVFAAELGVNAESLASSFDGVMIAGQGSGNNRCLDISFDGTLPFAVGVKKDEKTEEIIPNGPGHCDQSKFRAVSSSHQCFLTLTEADLQDVSTVLLAPTKEWSLQGVQDELKRAFPDFYTPTAKTDTRKRKRDQASLSASGGYKEGYFFPPEQRDHLIEKNICKVIKPKLMPGDMLVWDSAMPHYGGCYNVPGATRGPRLGLISAFAPKNMVPHKIVEKRKEWIGGGYATGQQVIFAERHKSTLPRCARFNVTDPRMPPAYKVLQEMRQRIRKGEEPRMYEDREDDDEETKEYRAKLRSLLF